MQQPTVTATILMSRASTRHDVCSATVLVRAADGSAVPQATVTFKKAPTIPARTATSNAAGRITVMMQADAATKSCTLQLLGVKVPGEPLTIRLYSAAMLVASHATKTFVLRHSIWQVAAQAMVTLTLAAAGTKPEVIRASNDFNHAHPDWSLRVDVTWLKAGPVPDCAQHSAGTPALVSSQSHPRFAKAVPNPCSSPCFSGRSYCGLDPCLPDTPHHQLGVMLSPSYVRVPVQAAIRLLGRTATLGVLRQGLAGYAENNPSTGQHEHHPWGQSWCHLSSFILSAAWPQALHKLVASLAQPANCSPVCYWLQPSLKATHPSGKPVTPPPGQGWRFTTNNSRQCHMVLMHAVSSKWREQ